MSSQGCQLYVLKVSYGSIQPLLSSSNLSRYLLNDLRNCDMQHVLFVILIWDLLEYLQMFVFWVAKIFHTPNFCKQEYNRNFRLLAVEPSLCCFYSSLMCFIIFVTGDCEWLGENPVFLLKLLGWRRISVASLSNGPCSLSLPVLWCPLSLPWGRALTKL
jgi:hypothetical protein